MKSFPEQECQSLSVLKRYQVYLNNYILLFHPIYHFYNQLHTTNVKLECKVFL